MERIDHSCWIAVDCCSSESDFENMENMMCVCESSSSSSLFNKNNKKKKGTYMMTPTTIATATTTTTTGRWTIDGTVGHGNLEGFSRQIRSTQRYGHGGLGRFGKLDECISCRLILSPVISRSRS